MVQIYEICGLDKKNVDIFDKILSATKVKDHHTDRYLHFLQCKCRVHRLEVNTISKCSCSWEKKIDVGQKAPRWKGILQCLMTVRQSTTLPFCYNVKIRLYNHDLFVFIVVIIFVYERLQFQINLWRLKLIGKNPSQHG